MRYQIHEKVTTMNYQYISPLLIFGIYMQDFKLITGTRDAKQY